MYIYTKVNCPAYINVGSSCSVITGCSNPCSGGSECTTGICL
jgi:hypothetical protein